MYPDSTDGEAEETPRFQASLAEDVRLERPVETKSVVHRPIRVRSRTVAALHEAEKRKLRDAFLDLKDRQRTGVILISGPRGSGMTHLAGTLKKPVESMGGYFLAGKIDQLQKKCPSPFPVFVAALDQFASKVVERGPDTVKAFKEKVMNELGTDVSLLIQILPSLEDIFGSIPEVTSSARAGLAIRRLLSAVYRFMKTISSAEHPMVIALNDIHWGEESSADIMRRLMLDATVGGLIYVGTCDEALESEAPVPRAILDLSQTAGSPIVRIRIKGLGTADTAILLRSKLEMDDRTSSDLAVLVQRVTGGNLAFAVMLTDWMIAKELLVYEEGTASWYWDIDEIEVAARGRRYEDFIVDTLDRLPPKVQDVLKVASCVGSRANKTLVELVLGSSISSELVFAENVGLINIPPGGVRLSFEQDIVETVAYSHLIPDEDKEAFHLNIGRNLWRQLEWEELDRRIFTVLGQMLLGKRLITDARERTDIAKLCLHAGKKAAKTSFFRAASVYLEMGIELLSERTCWRDEYDLTMALYNAGAEVAMCIGNHERMNELVNEVLRYARTLLDKMSAYGTRIYALGTSEHMKEAIDLGVGVLGMLGEHLPPRPQPFQLMREMHSVRRKLRGKSDQKILRMAIMENSEKKAAMQILNLLSINGIMTCPEFCAFAVLRMTNITMEHGLSVFASMAFATFGLVSIAVSNLNIGSVSDGIRWGDVSLALLHRFNAREMIPRVYAIYYGAIYPLKGPMTDVFEPLHQGQQIGISTGDLHGACICALVRGLASLEVGRKLPETIAIFQTLHDAMGVYRQAPLRRLTEHVLRSLRVYVGTAQEGSRRTNSVRTSRRRSLTIAVSSLEETFDTASDFFVSLVMNDFERSVQLSKMMRKNLWKLPPSFQKMAALFKIGLVCCDCIRRNYERRTSIRRCKRMIRELRQVAKLAPDNYLEKVHLLEAELASAQGRPAKDHYLSALAVAKHTGFPISIALCHERMARHYYSLDEKKVAQEQFEKALAQYQSWGATAKVDRLRAEVEPLFR